MIVKAGHYEPVAREGFVFIIPPFLASLGCWWYGHPWTSLLFLVLAVAIALFFRNPDRTSPQGEGIVVSPADGRVVQIVTDPGSPSRPGIPVRRISIFMSIFNVHVNRWPISGTVERIAHASGKFLDAREPEASKVNERNAILVTADDRTVEVVQIAGKVARRIACWVAEGDRVRQGERFGLIRFGSRLDVYLPEDFSFVVDVGASVRAGETVIARK